MGVNSDDHAQRIMANGVVIVPLNNARTKFHENRSAAV
jgi:hypothetical protein